MSQKNKVKSYAKKSDARPFLKWVGGKGRLLNQYRPFFPIQFNNYYEPFLGGGAVFFELHKQYDLENRAALFDSNAELINAYRTVRDKPQPLLSLLEQHQAQHSHDYYYTIRNQDRTHPVLDSVTRAARTIYLNKTCYNGLFRVNKKGFFNVPIGRYKNPAIFTPHQINAASKALNSVILECRDFRDLLNLAAKGDLIYFDPPYVPLSSTADFTSYTANNFSWDDQQDLARVFRELADRGCLVMLSNSFTPQVQELYREFRQEVIMAQRAINSRPTGRGALPELLILSF